jgi:hypothetical protein
MKRRKKTGPIDKPFFPVTDEIWLAPAWRAMSLGARMLYLALRRRYNYSYPNNGRIFLSQREAERELNSKRLYIARWLREHQHFGFTVMMSAGRLGVDGHGRAPRWRLTELPCKGEPATKNFLAWNGSPFVDEKTEPRLPKGSHPGSQKGAKETRRGNGANVASGSQKGAIREAPKREPDLEGAFHLNGETRRSGGRVPRRG